ncbi:TPA: hypothetical protein ACIRVD_002032 [Enterobacter roggenkampii]
MALQLLAANNAQSVLAAGISASATSLTLNTGTGALFPSPVSGVSFFKLTLIDAATGQLSEIVHVTAKSGDVLTIVRGQEGTSSRAWSANDIAANMLTAGTILLLAQLESPSFTGTPTGPTAAPGTNTTQLATTAFIQAAITDLILGPGAPAIGIPFFWPLSAMPNTVMPEWSNMVFLKFNGATFSAATYPKLALVFPALTLPEARGEFIRIWDDGRGVDSGRALGSAQSGQNAEHTHKLLLSAGAAGGSNVIAPSPNLSGTYGTVINQPGGSTLTAIETVGGNEARPRNIAFNFLVRAK